VKSRLIYQSSCQVMPGGVSSPIRSFSHVKTPPIIAHHGKGDMLTDVDGKSYIDFCMSWGALILGHAHERVVKAACEEIQLGSSFGLSTEGEEKLATKIVELLPSVEKIRFVSSGTEATMTAIRLARGFTERPKIVKFTGHYHGHSDSLLVQAGSGVFSVNSTATSKGVNLSTVGDTICLAFNDFDAVSALFEEREDIAAVIVEPIAANMGVIAPEAGFLEFLRECTRARGTLLIFDEVITGFRTSLSGAQGRFAIDPDLTCLGKIIGGGFSVGALGGKAEIMDHLAPLGDVYQAGTLSGNPVTMRAGIETLLTLEGAGFYETLEKKAQRFAKPVENAIQTCGYNVVFQRIGSMFTLFFGIQEACSREDLKNLDQKMFARFFHFLRERGVYFSPSPYEACFLSSAHSDEHLDFTAEAILRFFEEFL